MAQPLLSQVLDLIRQSLQDSVLSSLSILAYLIVAITLRNKCSQWSHFTDKESSSERLKSFFQVTQLLHTNYAVLENSCYARNYDKRNKSVLLGQWEICHT